MDPLALARSAANAQWAYAFATFGLVVLGLVTIIRDVWLPAHMRRLARKDAKAQLEVAVQIAIDLSDDAINLASSPPYATTESSSVDMGWMADALYNQVLELKSELFPVEERPRLLYLKAIIIDVHSYTATIDRYRSMSEGERLRFVGSLRKCRSALVNAQRRPRS